MDKQIEELAFVIRNCSMDNTYKMAWIRALVDYCVLNKRVGDILFNDLAPLVAKYYWNQTIFFNLEQGPNPHKRPLIHQIILDEIRDYQNKYGNQPLDFTRIEKKVNIDYSKISQALEKDVCWRFPRINNTTYKFYDLDRKNMRITLYQPNLLRKYSDILYELINYRWTQKLEDLNTSPRIAKKVKAASAEKIKRGSLNKFKKYLDLSNPEKRSFISASPIKDKTPSIDHVIPWSYLYSDDLWNLVYVEKSENSSKSNRIPNENMIKKLEARNQKLAKLLDKEGMRGKHVEELKLAIEQDYVRKFWVGCKG